ncbi:MAG: hypothetical protein ACYCXI_08475 [Dethiobacteraceae bacterium]|jgi:5-methylcytosine-specific restriction protein B
MGLYWIAPNSFLNLEQRNTWYIYESGKIPAGVVSSLPAIETKIKSKKYFDIVEKLRSCRRPPTVSVRERFFLARFDGVVA